MTMIRHWTRIRRLALQFLVGWAAPLAAQGSGDAADSVEVAGDSEICPDTMPADVLDHTEHEFGIPLDVVMLTFEQGTPSAEKADIVSSVRGRVIGGARLPRSTGCDGQYVVRIPTTPDIIALAGVIDQLHRTPHVVSASMFTQFTA